MLFNPQAVLSYSPGGYAATLPNMPAGNGIITASRKQNSGRYDLDSTSSAQVSDAVAALGLGGYSRNATYDREDICRILHSLGARFEVSAHQPSPTYCAFLQAQVEALAATTPDPVLLQAQGDFEQLADSLLKHLQKTLYPKFKIRTGTNPVWARSLASRREGVFLWPDWQDSRYVNVVLGCSIDDRAQLRDLVLDWSEASRVRINPQFAF